LRSLEATVLRSHIGRSFRKRPERSVRVVDPVTSEIRSAVLLRDGACAAWLIDRSHVCRDAYGTPHDPRRLAVLSIEHIKDELRMGKRAPSDLEHLVALCYGANVGVPSKELRVELRAYLATVADPHAAHVDPCGPTCREATR
jgi:hypothetical protein